MEWDRGDKDNKGHCRKLRGRIEFYCLYTKADKRRDFAEKRDANGIVGHKLNLLYPFRP